MKKEYILVTILAVLLLASTVIAQEPGTTEYYLDKIVTKLNKIKNAIQDLEMNPTVNVENNVPVPDVTVNVQCECDITREEFDALVARVEALEGPPPECSVDSDCDDSNTCTDDACVDGSCVYTPVADNTQCYDGLFCTGIDLCIDGVCTSGIGYDCTAYDSECTVGVCNEDLDTCEEINKPDGTSCDDGDACTEQDTCESGVCTGQPVICDDGNECTDDYCDIYTGACQHPGLPPGTPCGDQTLTDCDSPDTCDGTGVCLVNWMPDGWACPGGECQNGVCVQWPSPA